MASGAASRDANRTLSGSGTLFALTAYGIWGFAPIYWKQLSGIDASEILAYRAIGGLAFATLLLAAAGQLGDIRTALRGSWLLVASGLLLGVNWWVFIWAVNSDRIVETSLGYYLTPLLNIAMGLTVFGERLSPLQWVAVGLAGLGVAYMAWDQGHLPWISLALGGSFAVYGALRKFTGVPSIGGFVVEASLFLLPASLYLAVRQVEGESALAHLHELPPGTLGLLAGCGVVTATPLLCFASAAKRLPLTALGFFQYIAPTLSLGVAIGLYGEAFTSTHAVTFSLIWSALLLYAWDNRRKNAQS